MATGSKASGRERLQNAKYRTGRAQFEPRCDRCMHCAESANGKQHGRYCEAHRAEVKTHGVCERWWNRSAQE